MPISLEPRIRLGCISVRTWPEPALAVEPWVGAGAGLVWAHAEPAIKAARGTARCILSMSSSVCIRAAEALEERTEKAASEFAPKARGKRLGRNGAERLPPDLIPTPRRRCRNG